MKMKYHASKTQVNENEYECIRDEHLNLRLVVKTRKDAEAIASLWNKIGATWEGEQDPLGILDTPTL